LHASGRASAAALALVALAAGPAHADDVTDAADATVARADVGAAAHDALPGLVRLGVPVPLERGFVVSAAGSYGYTGDVLGDADKHHRTGGTLALSYRPRAFIGFALRLDGRHDAHSGSTDGKDDGWVGDTRLELRVVAPRPGALGYGGSATLWFPTASAFSPEADAISFDAEGWLGVRVAPRLRLVGGAGVRVDRSANSVPGDVDLLSRADRLALGVGDGTDLLLGAGAYYTRAAATYYGEWTWDVPLSGDARPSPLEAPMRADLGFRYRLGRGGPTLEASAEVELSKRPDLMATVPLAPVEPRVTLLAAISWSFGGARGPATITPVTTVDEPVTSVAPPVQRVRGRLVLPTGEPLAGVRVHIGARETTTDADGSFELADVPAGEALLEADVPLPWAKITTTVVVGGGAPLALGDVPVVRALPPGQIRGVVRTLTGKAVQANVTLLPIGQKVVAGAQGDFRVDVPPGEYDVLVEAPGFAPQKRHVVVDENGVTVLNVDLRTARPGQGQDH
jgi:hypothetical protein